MDSRSKCFCVVDTELLFKTLCNKTGLVLEDVALGITFMAKNKTQINNIGIWQCINNLPGTECLDLGEFFLDCSFPFFCFWAFDDIIDAWLILRHC